MRSEYCFEEYVRVFYIYKSEKIERCFFRYRRMLSRSRFGCFKTFPCINYTCKAKYVVCLFIT